MTKKKNANRLNFVAPKLRFADTQLKIAIGQWTANKMVLDKYDQEIVNAWDEYCREVEHVTNGKANNKSANDNEKPFIQISGLPG